MKTLVKIELQEKSNEEIILAVEKSMPGYHKDSDDREFYYEADGEILKQIFCDDEYGDDTIEWSIQSKKIGGLGTKLEVNLEC